MELWRQHNLQSIQFTRLPERKMFYLDNPLIKNLPKDYEQYLIDPLTIHFAPTPITPSN